MATATRWTTCSPRAAGFPRRTLFSGGREVCRLWRLPRPRSCSSARKPQRAASSAPRSRTRTLRGTKLHGSVRTAQVGRERSREIQRQREEPHGRRVREGGRVRDLPQQGGKLRVERAEILGVIVAALQYFHHRIGERLHIGKLAARSASASCNAAGAWCGPSISAMICRAISAKIACAFLAAEGSIGRSVRSWCIGRGEHPGHAKLHRSVQTAQVSRERPRGIQRQRPRKSLSGQDFRVSLPSSGYSRVSGILHKVGRERVKSDGKECARRESNPQRSV